MLGEQRVAAACRRSAGGLARDDHPPRGIGHEPVEERTAGAGAELVRGRLLAQVRPDVVDLVVRQLRHRHAEQVQVAEKQVERVVGRLDIEGTEQPHVGPEAEVRGPLRHKPQRFAGGKGIQGGHRQQDRILGHRVCQRQQPGLKPLPVAMARRLVDGRRFAVVNGERQR